MSKTENECVREREEGVVRKRGWSDCVCVCWGRSGKHRLVFVSVLSVCNLCNLNKQTVITAHRRTRHRRRNQAYWYVYTFSDRRAIC